MTLIQAVQGVFTSPALEAAAWGMAASFALCVALVLTKRWHGALTMDHMEGKHVGMIVLGGAIERPEAYKAHGQVPLGDAAERMIEPVAIMRNHPKLHLVFTGGEGRLLATGVSEAELAKVFYEQQGVDMSRVTFESGSRTTRENALQVAQLLGDKCKQPWLLVTSAWHMPRSMEEFKAVGCNVTAYPVDFWTSDKWDWTDYSLAHSLVHWQTALHEWLGIWVYRLTR